MKAIVLKAYGGPEQLDYAERPEPAAAAGQVLVRMHASSYNPIDAKLASGAMKLALPLTFPFVPGGDVAGVVEALGEGVAGFEVGDAVFGYSAAGGAYAERIAVPAAAIAHKPANLDFADAAALSLVGQTGAQALAASGVVAGDSLVVIGAAGAVGSVIVQIASRMGVKVTAISDARDGERLRAIGAHEIVTRGFDASEAPRDIAAVIDAVGGEGQLRAFTMLRRGGTLVALNQPPSQEEAERLGVRAVLVRTAGSTASLDILRERIEAGMVRPFVGRRYPLADAARMWRDAASRSVGGKLILEIAGA